MRVTKRKTEKNRRIKGQLKSAIKATKTALSEGKTKEARQHFQRAQKALDKASQKKVLHKNTVARMKSRLNKEVKAVAKK